jgi:hypothetical protein
LASWRIKSPPFCAGGGRHCPAERGDLVLLRPGAADCLYPGDRHHGADYRLSLRPWPGDADVDYLRRRAARPNLAYWCAMPTRCSAPAPSTRWCLIKPAR